MFGKQECRLCLGLRGNGERDTGGGDLMLEVFLKNLDGTACWSY
jgi:hypothetical protein